MIYQSNENMTQHKQNLFATTGSPERVPRSNNLSIIRLINVKTQPSNLEINLNVNVHCQNRLSSINISATIEQYSCKFLRFDFYKYYFILLPLYLLFHFLIHCNNVVFLLRANCILSIVFF